MKFTEANLMGSYYNDFNNTCDLEFIIDGKTAWVRNAKFMEDVEVTEDYWTDAYAIESGAKIEEE